MQLNEQDTKQIEAWLSDPSFVEWIKQEDEVEAATFYWDVYFKARPEKQKLAQVARSLLTDLTFQPIPEQALRKENALKKMWDTIEERAIDRRPRKIRKYKHFVAIAATFALLVIAIFGWQVWNQQTILLAADYGERKGFYLPDSSYVVLNANSTLSYKKNHPRQVKLEGEAYFEVKKQVKKSKKTPFQVETNSLKVKVLGTVFNVSQREAQTKVFLKEGQVELTIDLEIDTVLLMQPGELISFSNETQRFEKTATSKEMEAISWKDGTIQFENQSLLYITQQMDYIYGVKIYLSDEKMKARKLTIALPNENLSVALQTLENVLGEILEKVESKAYLIRKVE